MITKKFREQLALVATFIGTVCLLLYRMITLTHWILYALLPLTIALLYLVYWIIKDVVIRYRYKIKTVSGRIYLARSYEVNAYGNVVFQHMLTGATILISAYEIIDYDYEYHENHH